MKAVIAAENEIRDGAGRGFNERQDRASAATVEIDEEVSCSMTAARSSYSCDRTCVYLGRVSTTSEGE